MSLTSKRILTVFLTLSLLSVVSCSTVKNPQDPRDPYESYNRKVFKFNRGFDRFVFRPIAKGYDTVVPHVVQKRVSSFFGNVNQLPTIANDLLQVNIPWAAQDTARFVINSTAGIGGLFDVATPMGLKRHRQDFGLTLAKWGIRDSNYLLVPFLPPLTTRDLIGYGVDYTMLYPWFYVKPTWVAYSAWGLDVINQRANLLGIDKLVDDAFDPYIFVRDAFFQKRQAQIQKILNPAQFTRENDEMPESSNSLIGS